MGITTHKTLIEFDYEGNNFKMIDEFNKGIGIYIDGKEIGRDKQFFAIPFISQCIRYYSFTNKKGDKVNIMTKCPHRPYARTLSVYFDGILVKQTKI